MNSKVFITGATGNVGAQTVRALVAANTPTTIYVRDEQKALKLFEKEANTGLLTIVQGDYNTDETFSKAIQGHDRLLLSIADLKVIPHVKQKFARMAYAAGVKQIVDISGFNVKHFHGSGEISLQAGRGEEAVRREAEQSGGYFVIIRGGDFMTNTLFGEAHYVKAFSKVVSVAKESRTTTLIDPRDIGDAAASIFLDSVEKHGNSIYDAQVEALSYTERIAIYSKVLGKKINFEQVGVVDRYNHMIQHGMYHRLAYDYVSVTLANWNDPTPQLEILLKKKPRTFVAFVQENRHLFE